MSLRFEELSEKIYNKNTKQYFEEVLNSYHNGNYRSAVVMLYSVVIADIFFKLDELKNLYNDTNAITILDKIDKNKTKNPRSGEWENILTKDISSMNILFEQQTHHNIEYLRGLRHLCAHPALDSSYELFMPNKETVAGCIANMLEEVLTAPPVFAKKVTDRLKTDIAALKDKFLFDLDNFKNYLKSVYFQKMNQRMFIKVFRDIWKLVFTVDNEECTENRYINYHCLRIMYEYKKTDINREIQQDPGYFSNVTPKDIQLKCFIYYIANYPELYTYFGEGIKSLIGSECASKPNIRVLCYFMSSSMEEHLQSLDSDEDYYDENQFISSILETQKTSNIEFNNYCLRIFSKSASFNTSDIRFDRYIRPNLNFFNEEQLEKLISVINDNDQIYNRKRSYIDNTEVFRVAKTKLLPDYNYNQFARFRYDESVATKPEFDDKSL